MDALGKLKAPQEFWNMLILLSGSFEGIMRSGESVESLVSRFCQDRDFCEIAGLRYSDSNETIIEAVVRYYLLTK